MIYNGSEVEINIPNNEEKGKWGTVGKFFVPVLIVLVAVGAFGLIKLKKIEQARVPVTVEYASATTSPYIGARGGTAYYLPWCASAARIKDDNKIWFSSKIEAEKAGYKPAQNCPGM